MPNGVQIDARRDFVRRRLPWLIGAAMLVFYALTLNHWVSLTNLGGVVSISGWTWTPQYNTPLFYLATAPFRLLPAADVPAALNVFSALCAALSLGLLARSVALLPHDRTEAQQVRERNDFFLLTLRSAWLPPILAALLCGLQLTFWEMATNGGSETFNLLLFALVTWSLVEYRLDGRVWRLYTSAVVVGAGILEGPAIMAFFPLFLVAVIWVRGLAFFNVRFLARMLVFGAAGFVFVLFYQLAPHLWTKSQMTLWETLRAVLGAQVEVLRLYWGCVTSPGTYFDDLLMPLFISLMPLLVMSVRWKFGDNSKLGSSLASLMFHAIHAIFLGVCLWLAFDPPFSPREKGLGLTMYYLIALSAGYYAGYFLLVFGRRRPRAKDQPTLLATIGNKSVVAAVWIAIVLALAGLAIKNGPLVRAANDNTLRTFSTLLVKNLPAKGAIVLSDDPERMFLAKAALTAEGRATNYLLVDSEWLPYPQYHRYLHRVAPQKWPLFVKPQATNSLNPLGLIELLAFLGRTNELYYLHPSFGYYFEEFYLEPHGLVYKLKTLPEATLLPPLPDKDLIAENETFWEAARTDGLESVENALAPPDPSAPKSFADRQLESLHVPHEPNVNAILVGNYCSRSLDFWGVELQRSGDLTDAAVNFREALKFNPDNVAAQLNLTVNSDLAAGRTPSADSSEATPEKLGRFKNLSEALSEDGPIDDPAFCFQYGFALAQENDFFRQAVAPLHRSWELDPDYLPARIWLARVYGMNHMPDLMLKVLRAPMDGKQEPSEAGSTELNMLLSAAYFQKNDLAKGTRLLQLEIARDPTNQTLLTTIAQVYMNHGMFSNALEVADKQLQFAPDNASWLLTKGYIYNQLKEYPQAIAALEHALSIQKENESTLFQLANAYYGAGKLDTAKTNYEMLQESHTNSPQLAFDLEEIAWQQHDTNEAIRNIQIYLANTRTNTPEYRLMMKRLGELKR